MSIVINTNLPSIIAQRNLAYNSDALTGTLERLSSGLRVNRAADDAAGLSIANKLNFQARGLNQAVRNTGDASSLVQTADGAFGVLTNILNRLRELAIQSASDINTTADRLTLKSESDGLISEITRIATTTEFNRATLLDGSFTATKIHVGANADQTVSFSLGDIRASQLGKFAMFSVNIADGIGNESGTGSTFSGFGGLTGGEFKINGQSVGGTNATDDQVSVLELFYKNNLGTSLALGDGALGASGANGSAAGTSVNSTNLALALANGDAALYINGTAITSLANISGQSAFSGVSAAFGTNSAFVTNFVAKINGAGITNVTARVNNDGSTYALVAAKGTDLRLALSVVSTVGTSGYQAANSFKRALSNIGLVSQVVGSGNAASEISIFNGQAGAIAKAAAINSVKTKTGVTATALQNDISAVPAVTAGSLAGSDLIINGVGIDAVAGITAGDGTGALRAAINTKTSSTGVVASVNSSGDLVLSAADGRNITVFATGNGSTITSFASGVSVFRGGIKFVSQDSVSFTGATADIGSASTSTPFAADLTNAVSTIDISTQVGSNTAILSLDAALTQISQLRSGVGALQNRLDLTIQALQVAAENQTAAESRIRDADFAFETAQFTRNQILVQAGTAIVTQANTSPQIALQLLPR